MNTAGIYLQLGFEHILPLGIDHILFVVCLFLLSNNLKTLIWQATVFTIAHSITLAIAALKLISISPHIIEPIIALSIVIVALENIFITKLKPSRIILVFTFGLVHGLGFASALTDLGLPQNQFFISLLSFNMGVELGQLTVILIAWFLIGKWFSEKEWYRKRVTIPASLIIAGIATYWTIERIFFV